MSAERLDGKAIANQIKQELAVEVAEFTRSNGVVPCLAAILVGDDPASHVYVRNKRRACERIGIDSQLQTLPVDTPEDELLQRITQLNSDPSVHGILVQLPLPSHVDSTLVLDAIRPEKDVDAFHPDNVGRLAQGRPRFLPCTPHGIQQILHRSHLPIAGKHVVIVGRSDIVGKPLALMLVQRTSPLGSGAANASVTICHSRTNDLPGITREADVLVAAVGRARLITADWVKPGAIVIDVGINRTDDGKLVGDVDFQGVQEVASHLTPVPGGVGPLTIAMLMRNTLTAAELSLA